jgi:hypothetical protein
MPNHCVALVAVNQGKDVLLTHLGMPTYENGYWLWRGGHELKSRKQLEGLGGTDWWKKHFPDLPGSPFSYMTHAQFCKSFVIKYYPHENKLVVKMDRDRYIDGGRVTFEGKC